MTDPPLRTIGPVQGGRLDRAIDAVAARPGLAATLLFVGTFLVAAIVSWASWPQPRIHDEFSYLLAADTFAQGRVANPAHPHWEHFETFHVIQHPSYASKYPPGQGLVLALGQRLAGNPLAAVWCLSALASVSCYWMLSGWVAPRWALVGGLLCATHPGLQLVWGQSYWGGTLAFVGGALVVGGGVRMRRAARVADAVAMSGGACLLTLSRPFEGVVFCSIVGTWVAYRWFTMEAAPWRRIVLCSILPQAALLGALLLGLASYHLAITGDATTMPYQVHERAYGRSPLFLWQAPAAPKSYRHAVFTAFHDGWSMHWYQMQQTVSGWASTKLQLARQSAVHFFPPLLALPLVLIRPWRSGRLRFVLVVGGLTWIATWGTVWNAPHYVAALGPLCIAMMVWGLRQAEIAGRRWFGWSGAAACLVALHIISFAFAASSQVMHTNHGWHRIRAQIASELESTDEQHLVLVRYRPGHNPHQEWVYNGADIDGSPVVWARAMSPRQNAELADYFRERTIWLLEPDAQPIVLRPYQPPAGNSAATQQAASDPVQRPGA